MFLIRDLKFRARAAIRKNYGVVVLVALIFSFINGSLVTSGSNPGTKHGVESLNPISEEENAVLDTVSEEDLLQIGLSPFDSLGFPGALTTAFLIVVILILMLSFLLNIFLFNPLKVGCARFFLLNSEGFPGLKELGYAFRNNYFNIVKAMFLRDVFIFLWTLLFIFPGIVKSYSYKMVPYLLAENPELSALEAIDLSRDMMRGYKITGFIIDLSFIGWIFLSNLTFGFSGVLYSNPYYFATNTEFYKELKNLIFPANTDPAFR